MVQVHPDVKIQGDISTVTDNAESAIKDRCIPIGKKIVLHLI